MTRLLPPLVSERLTDGRAGVTSVCTAHPIVIEAALSLALRTDRRVLIEATCNQVNQEGGYTGMTPADFRRIALSLEGAEESSHMGSADFRVGGRIFATLASQKQGYGNLMLTPEQQAEFVEEQPEVFLPVAGGWGKSGATHIRLSEANEDVLTGALQAAWQVRKEKNAKVSKKKRAPQGNLRK